MNGYRDVHFEAEIDRIERALDERHARRSPVVEAVKRLRRRLQNDEAKATADARS